jgi:serine/threonine-protein kinase
MSEAAADIEPSPISEDESFEGQVVGAKYEVGPRIGTGGMGTVWLGQHIGLGTKVAIKFIRPQFAERPDARRRFEIEARAAALIKSRNAVRVFDYGLTEHGRPYIVMEYLEGESLSEALIRRGPLPSREAALIIAQAAKALSKAHAANIVHRDLKPDNIFLATNAEGADQEELGYVVKLVDFGIAKMLDVDPEKGGLKGPTQEGSVIGTPNFMSPEQLTVGGIPNALTDIWSLGACAFAAFTARIPFEGDVLGDIVLKVCVEPMPQPSQLVKDAPPGLDGWFSRACHRDATKRFQTAQEMAEQLLKVCGTGPVRIQTLDEDKMQFALKAKDPTVRTSLVPDDLPSVGMNPKTALLTGIVVGVSLMVALLGFLAWRDNHDAGTGAYTPAASSSAEAGAP